MASTSLPTSSDYLLVSPENGVATLTLNRFGACNALFVEIPAGGRSRGHCAAGEDHGKRLRPS
jgi:hypothetical protein